MKFFVSGNTLQIEARGLCIRSYFKWLVLLAIIQIRILLMMFCLVLPTQATFAQDSTQTNWQEFYPLNLNDYWIYIYEDELFRMVITEKVTGSELKPNGKEYARIFYKNLTTGDKGFQFERVDSLGDVYLYSPPPTDKEFLLYRLNVEVGDTWPDPPDENAFWLVEQRLVGTVCGKESISLFIDLKNAATIQSIILVEGLGETYRDGEGGVSISLQGAVINGCVEGDTSQTTDVEALEVGDVPRDFFIENAHPNPFNHATHINYSLKQRSQVKLSIFNIRGELVKTMLNQTREGGEYFVRWDGRNANGNLVANGLYFVVLRVGGHLMAKKVIFRK